MREEKQLKEEKEYHFCNVQSFPFSDHAKPIYMDVFDDDEEPFLPDHLDQRVHPLQRYLDSLLRGAVDGRRMALLLLPEEVLWNCLLFLSVGEVLVFGSLSRSACLVCKSEVLWECLVRRDFDIAGNPHIDRDSRPSVLYKSNLMRVTRTRKQRVDRLKSRKRLGNNNYNVEQTRRNSSW